MRDPSITHFPVGNGDMALIQLRDGTNILLDCRIRDVEPGIYDVHGHLLDVLPKDGKGRPYVDVYILTHPDQDHCGGFAKHFYTGAPDDYGEKDRRAGRIIISELWFAPRIFREHTGDLCEDAKAFCQEAQRRIGLYTSGDDGRSDRGNRLRVIGASDDAALEGLDAILTVPGQAVNLINGKLHDDFRFFVYGPIKADSDGEDSERNDTSVILQARFDVGGQADAARIFLGGDAGCEKWERIIARNDDENLAWDIFLAPHHCSWSFFSSRPYDAEDPAPSDNIMHLLYQKRGQAYVISSSKPIVDNDDNPPCYGAKEIYESVVGERHFLCTGEHPNEEEPEPIYFTMTVNGPVKDQLPRQSRVGAVEKAVSKPRTYG